jgi:hypothetical protein
MVEFPGRWPPRRIRVRGVMAMTLTLCVMACATGGPVSPLLVGSAKRASSQTLPRPAVEAALPVPQQEASVASVPVPVVQPSVEPEGLVRGGIWVPLVWLNAEQQGLLRQAEDGAWVFPDGPAVIGQNGGSVIGQNGGSVIGQNGGSVIGQNGGSVIGQNGGSVIGQNGGSVIGQNGGSVIGQNGGSVIGQNGAGVTQVRLAGVFVSIKDASGVPVRDAQGDILQGVTDETGRFSVLRSGAKDNAVISVPAPAWGGEMLGFLAAEPGPAKTAISVDFSSTLTMRRVLERHVQGSQSILNRLTPTIAQEAREELNAGVLNTPGEPDLKPERLDGLLSALEQESGAVSDVFKRIAALLVFAGVVRDGDGLPALQVNFGSVSGLARDAAATWIFSRSHHVLWRVGSDGITQVIVPSGAWGYSETFAIDDNARPYHSGMLLDDDGVILADTLNHRVVRASEGGVRVLAGGGPFAEGSLASSAVEVELRYPTGLARLSDGRLAFAEAGRNRVLVLQPDGTLLQLVGAEPQAAQVASEVLNWPQGLLAEGADALWVADYGNHRVRSLRLSDGSPEDVVASPALQSPVLLVRSPAGVVVANELGRLMDIRDGVGQYWDQAPGYVPLPAIIRPESFTWRENEAFLASGNGRIFALDGESRVARHWGGSSTGGTQNIEFGMRFAQYTEGRWAVADFNLMRVLAVSGEGGVTPLAGNGQAGFRVAGLPPLETPLDKVSAIIRAPDGALVFSVGVSHPCVKRLGPDGVLSTLVGNGVFGAEVLPQGPRAAVALGYVRELAYFGDGRLLMGDDHHRRILVLDPNGYVEPYGEFSDLTRVRGLKAAGPNSFVCAEQTRREILRVAPGGVREVLLTEADAEPFLKFGDIQALVMGPDGALWLGGGALVLRKPSDGPLTVLAGAGGTVLTGGSRDQTLRDVRDLAFDERGDLFILETDQIKRVPRAMWEAPSQP